MEKKVEWGWKQYFRPTPKNIQRFLLFLKGILGSSAILAAVDEKPYWSIGLLIFGALVDEAVKFLGTNPEIEAVELAKDALKDKVAEAANEIIDETTNDQGASNY